MHRDRQFDMRENPASDRRHGSRLSVSMAPSSHCFEQVKAGPLITTPHTETPSTDTHAFAHAATTQAVTVEREPKSQLLTVQEVADLLRVQVSWVYERTRKRSLDRLPGYRVGKYWRFREDEIHAWVKRQCGESCSA